MRLIDSDKLLEAVMAQSVVDKSVAKRLIIQAQTVGAVEAVLCKECKWLGIGERGDGTRLVMCCKKHHDTTEENYCSEGVSREDDPSD